MLSFKEYCRLNSCWSIRRKEKYSEFNCKYSHVADIFIGLYNGSFFSSRTRSKNNSCGIRADSKHGNSSNIRKSNIFICMLRYSKNSSRYKLYRNSWINKSLLSWCTKAHNWTTIISERDGKFRKLYNFI